MQIVVKASNQQKTVLESMEWLEPVQFHWVTEGKYVLDADLYFDLCFEEEGWTFEEIPSTAVFVNAVFQTSESLPSNAIRLNAWNSFLNRPIWEIASSNQANNQNAILLLEKIGRKAVIVPDEPGLIAAPIIAMIINEAYFALDEKISTKVEIDTAMKLGTNYPYGPFEWAGIIGLSKIAKLLQILFLKDERYAAAPALLLDLANQNTSN